MVGLGARVDRLENRDPLPMSAETQVPFPEDATHTEELVFFGERDVALADLTVQFRVQAELASWHKMVTKLNLEVIKEGSISRAVFYALPERLGQFRPFLATSVVLDEDMPGTATWDFAWSRAKDASPPAVMVKSSQAVGGFPNVLDRLGALWPVTTPAEARISAGYITLSDDWRFALASTRVKNVVTGERIHEARPTRWIINPPSGCVSEISQHLSPDDTKDFILRGQGTYTLQWTPRFLNEVDGAIWDGLKIFLKARRSTPKR